MTSSSLSSSSPIIRLPYVFSFQSLSCFFEGFMRLKKLSISIRITYYNGHPIWHCDPKDDFFIDWITDFFTEPIRLRERCHCNTLSPEEIYYRQFHLVQQTALDRYKSITPISLRQSLRIVSQECKSFRSSIALAVYRWFKPRTVLDPCARWGGRYMGAIASGVVQSYYGIDYEKDLEEPFLQIRHILGRNLCDCFKFGISFEDLSFAIPDSWGYFDLVFSSILPSLSLANCRIFITKAWMRLRVGGFMVLNLDNSKNNTITRDNLYHIVNSLPGVFPIQIFHIRGRVHDYHYYNIHAWKKNPSVITSRQRNSNRKSKSKPLLWPSSKIFSVDHQQTHPNYPRLPHQPQPKPQPQLLQQNGEKN